MRPVVVSVADLPNHWEENEEHVADLRRPHAKIGPAPNENENRRGDCTQERGPELGCSISCRPMGPRSGAQGGAGRRLATVRAWVRAATRATPAKLARPQALLNPPGNLLALSEPAEIELGIRTNPRLDCEVMKWCLPLNCSRSRSRGALRSDVLEPDSARSSSITSPRSSRSPIHSAWIGRRDVACFIRTYVLYPADYTWTTVRNRKRIRVASLLFPTIWTSRQLHVVLHFGALGRERRRCPPPHVSQLGYDSDVTWVQVSESAVTVETSASGTGRLGTSLKLPRRIRV